MKKLIQRTTRNNKGYHVNCGGYAVSMSYCYDKATELCPNGYKIVNKDIGTIQKGILIECSRSN